MADLVFKISPNIVLGSYTSSRLGLYAKDFGSRFILLLDPVLREEGSVDSLFQSLAARNVEYFVFDEITGAADSETIRRALALAKEAHVHGVIAIGGSSVMNVARALCSIYNEVHGLYDFLDGSNPTAGALPLIALPSTIRNMFLFSDNVPVVDARNKQIKLLKIQNGLCKLALFDPNFTVSLTENQRDSISLDALCIAIEAFVSQKASFFSDMLSEKAIQVLGYALDGSQSLSVTSSSEVLLSQGGCMASLAVATSCLGPASLLGLAIHSRYNISHSLIACILFPYMIEDIAKYKADKIASVAKILNIVDDSVSPEEAAAALASSIRHKIAQANLPSRLKDLSLSMEQLSLAAEDAGQLDLINGMARSMTADDLFELIKLAY